MTALMIDSATSLDRDDAVTVSEDDRGWTATVFVAAVADAIPIGSVDDRAALSKVHTRYLRTKTEPMLGRELEDAATLTATADRPAVAIGMRFATDGHLENFTVTRAHLRAGDTVAYTHQQVGNALMVDSDDPHTQQLQAAYRLARTLIAGRRATGAFAMFDASRGMLTSEEGKLVALPSGQSPAAHLIVQELMVAANSTLAGWAIDHQLPILFRNHTRSAVAPPADDLLAEVTAELSSTGPLPPDQMQALAARINQTLRPATYQPVAVGHFGLQLPAYTHATSPLRRYADLVAQRQVLAHLDGVEPPYSPAALDDIAETINTTMRKDAEHKSAAVSQARRRQATSTIAAGDYSQVQGRDWYRILRIAADTALPNTLAAELRRRAEAGELDGGHLAVLMGARGQGWKDLLATLIPTIRQVTPQFAASALSAWRQQDGTDDSAPEVEHRQAGPDHALTFTARVTYAGTCTSWAVGPSKKVAEREALWELVEILAGLRSGGDPSQSPPPDEPTPTGVLAPARTAAAPAPADMSALSGKQWLRVSRELITTPGDHDDALAAELRRRADQGALDAPTIAALLTDGTGRWQPLLADLVATMRDAAPHEANSVLSVWQQLSGAPAGTPELEAHQSGQFHAPMFAVRAAHQKWLTQWRYGPAKKATAQQCLWDLVDLIAGNGTAGHPDDVPAPPAPDPAPAEPAPETDGNRHGAAAYVQVPPPARPASGPLPSSPAEVTDNAAPLAGEGLAAAAHAHPGLANVLGQTPTDRARKHRAAVKSPTAWINNLTAVLGSAAPTVDIAPVDGGFTATVAIDTPMGQLVDTGAGTNQKTARAAASLALLQRLFSA